MHALYNLGILFYQAAITIASFFTPKARQFVQGRKNWRRTLQEKIDPKARYIWFHCASLGEFEQGRPVIEAIRKTYPEYKIALSFFSPSGYEIRKNYKQADLVCYLPMDTPRNASDFIELLKPLKAFFVKYEFWHNYLLTLQKKNISSYCISAIFRKEQIFFGKTPWAKWFQQTLFTFEHLFVQNEESAKLLQDIGIARVSVAGDTRFDRVAEIARSAKKIEIVEKFKGGNVTLIAGSTWPPDEELLCNFINRNKQAKYIIAPHEISTTGIRKLKEQLHLPTVCFSEAQSDNIDQYQVLIIDCIGILSSLYQYGKCAYIGGGFGVGIHNILEAATFGLPVVFGPNHQKFKEANELKQKGGAYSISSQRELDSILQTLLFEEKEQIKASKICQEYIQKNTGATSTIVKKSF